MKINFEKDHYATLGVEKTVPSEEIRVAYRKLARKYHPDVNPSDSNAEEMFKNINEANEVLSDVSARSDYDKGENASPPASFWEAHQQQEAINSHVEMVITIDEHAALNQFKQVVQYSRRVYCAPCDGKGGKDEARTICPDCQGTGSRLYTAQHGAFFVHQQAPCQKCRQRGYIHHQSCSACNGFGVIDIPTTKEIVLPKGCIGRQYVVPDSGNCERREARPGHLVIRVGFQGSPKFQYGQDFSVVFDLEIDPVCAILGVEKQVVTLDGTEITCKVPPGCKEGHLQYFPQLGIPISESGRSPFIVRVMFDVPTKISPEEEKVLRQYLLLRQKEGQDNGTEEKNSIKSDHKKEETK